jgi:hypothetical protein
MEDSLTTVAHGRCRVLVASQWRFSHLTTNDMDNLKAMNVRNKTFAEVVVPHGVHEFRCKKSHATLSP